MFSAKSLKHHSHIYKFFFASLSVLKVLMLGYNTRQQVHLDTTRFIAYPDGTRMSFEYAYPRYAVTYNVTSTFNFFSPFNAILYNFFSVRTASILLRIVFAKQLHLSNDS